MATPVDWVNEIETVVTAFIATQDGYKVGRVLYHPGAAVRPDECCDGVLCIDAENWQATGDTWPNPRQGDGQFIPCGGTGALNITIKYMTCVTAALTDAGKRPPAEVQKSEQLGIMGLGYDLWLELLAQEKTWRKTLGKAKIGIAHRVPNGPTCAGFAMSIQTQLGVCRDA